MSKYNARITEVDGIKFDSKKEANYYITLKQMEARGEVERFDRQVEYLLQPKFIHGNKVYRPIKYIADFVVYYTDGTVEIVDVKGFKTKEYMLKKKMLLYTRPYTRFKEV